MNTDQEYQEEGGGVGRELTKQFVTALTASQPAIPERIQASMAIPSVD